VSGRLPVTSARALTFFVDRSLGSFTVPAALRAAGWVLETMDERYGSGKSPWVKDVEWIEDAAGRGDIILCKDLRIARNPLEADVVHRTSARAFGLARRDIDGASMAECFIAHEEQIFRMAGRVEGPYVVSVSSGGLRRMSLNLRLPPAEL
jgi:hypothetical protein